MAARRESVRACVVEGCGLSRFNRYGYCSKHTKLIASSRSNSEASQAPWVPNEASMNCMNCDIPFSIIRRRHHCRKCGGLFCSACTSHRLQSNDTTIRVCRACFHHEKRREYFEEHFLPVLLEGHIFKKDPALVGRTTERLVQLSRDKTSITWTKPGDDPNSQQKGFILLNTITSVTPGDTQPRNAKTLSSRRLMSLARTAVSGIPDVTRNDHCLSIISPERALFLEAESMERRDFWVEALNEAIACFPQSQTSLLTIPSVIDSEESGSDNEI